MAAFFLPATDMKTAMLRHVDTQYLLGLVADQSPGKLTSAYWLNFFERPTAFVSGPEKSAQLIDLPVVFAYMEKPKRGHYRAVIELAAADASKLPQGELTLKYARYLEEVQYAATHLCGFGAIEGGSMAGKMNMQLIGSIKKMLLQSSEKNRIDFSRKYFFEFF